MDSRAFFTFTENGRKVENMQRGGFGPANLNPNLKHIRTHTHTDTATHGDTVTHTHGWMHTDTLRHPHTRTPTLPTNRGTSATTTPLLAALQQKKSVCEIQGLIDNGADVNQRDQLSRSPMTVALDEPSGYNIDVIKLLVSSGRCNLKVHNEDGDTALHWAFRYDKIDLFEWLLENGFDINIQNYYEETVLHRAAKKKTHRNRIEYLISKGANRLAVDEFGDTPFILGLRKSCSLSLAVHLLPESFHLDDRLWNESHGAALESVGISLTALTHFMVVLGQAEALHKIPLQSRRKWMPGSDITLKAQDTILENNCMSV